MTDTRQLERGYRRILGCYPQDFRRENGEEILGVLLSSAAEGQRHVGLGESAALVRGALRMRLRPGPGHPPVTVFAAIRLMCLGAAITLAEAITLLGTAGSLPADIQRVRPGHATMVPLAIGVDMAFLVLGAVAWLWLAWAVGRRRDWARFLSVAIFALYSMGMIGALANDDASVAPAVVALACASWAVGLAVLVLVFSPRSWPYYRAEPA